MVNFDYALLWSNSAFNFTGMAPVTNDLLVISTEHQLKYLDANNAEITFGVQYDGMPQINTANMLFNALDEVTGVKEGSADWPYLVWVDLHNIFGLGKNIPILPGNNSDALLAFMPDDPGKAGIAMRLALTALGFGLFFAPNSRMLISRAPLERAAAAVSVHGSGRLIG